MRSHVRSWMPSAVLALGALSGALEARAQPAPPSAARLRVVETTKLADASRCPAGAQLLEDAAGEPAGCESWQDDRKLVQLRSGARLEVAALNATLVSSGGRTILKYGDFANLAVRRGGPRGWILYDATGKVLASRDRIDPNALVAMSGDGHFAVASRQDAEGHARGTLALYSPAGAEVFAHPLGEGVFATNIALGSGGAAIALTVSDAKRFREGKSTLVMYGKSREAVARGPELRWPNALVFAGDGKHLFVAARDSLVLLDAGGKVVWTVHEYFRLAGPGSIAVSADGTRVELVTAELTAERKDRYVWRAHVLSMTDGRPLGRIDLPGLHRAAAARVITRVSDRTFSVTTPDRDLVTIGAE